MEWFRENPEMLFGTGCQMFGGGSRSHRTPYQDIPVEKRTKASKARWGSLISKAEKGKR